jgi:hypothetical protein
MYTYSIYPFLKKESGQMIVHCFISYLKLIDVQNMHQQPQCSIDCNVQQSGIYLTELPVE